jgi:hypothetical protein
MKYLGDGAEGLAARALQKPCVICGQEATVAVAYQASGANAERLGAKPGKARIVFYSLCDAHPLDPATAERAESLLEALLAVNPPLIVPAEVIHDAVAIFEAEP